MNKILKTILFLIFPVASFCNEGDSVRSEKFQLGVVYSPELSYRTLKTDADYNWLKESRDNLEIPKFGYSMGINLGCKLSTRLMLEVEALYTDKGAKTKEAIIENKISSDGLEKIPYKNSLVYHYHYIDVPVKLNYFLCTGKVKFYITAGVSVNAFLNEQNTTFVQYKDGSSKKFNSTSTTGAEKINFAALAGFGINYNLSNHYIFKLEPVYKHSITPIANSPVRTYLYSTGINIGLSYIF